MTKGLHIDHYISELLFRYDCVVVPGLGGFVCNYAPARIHPTQHTFTPPSKQLVFNKNLQHNDGLLAHALASAGHCTYEEALELIAAFAETCHRELKSGHKVELKNIGTLWLDPEKNTQFEPDDAVNYLVESFGLSSFQTFPVKRETYTERRDVKTEDRIVPKEAETVPSRSRRVRRWVTSTIIILPLLSAGLWIPLRTDLLKGVNVAGFYPFGKKTPALYRTHTVPTLPDAKRYDTKTLQLTADSNGYALYDIGTPVTVQVYTAAPESTAVATSQPSTTAKTMTAQSGKYYVIAGAFAVPENAEHYRQQLIEKGFSPTLLQLKSRLQHVCYGEYDTRDAADAMLQKIKADNPGAWVLHQ